MIELEEGEPTPRRIPTSAAHLPLVNQSYFPAFISPKKADPIDISMLFELITQKTSDYLTLVNTNEYNQHLDIQGAIAGRGTLSVSNPIYMYDATRPKEWTLKIHFTKDSKGRNINKLILAQLENNAYVSGDELVVEGSNISEAQTKELFEILDNYRNEKATFIATKKQAGFNEYVSKLLGGAK